MLIRVVRAVNDFILPAGFSEKSIKEYQGGALLRRFFVERGDSGEGRAPSIVFATSRPGFGPALKEALAFALAFSLVFALIIHFNIYRDATWSTSSVSWDNAR